MDEFRTGLKNLMYRIGKSTEKVYATSKTKIEINNLSSKVDKSAKKLGFLVIEAQENGELSLSLAKAEVQSQLEEVALLKRKIEELKSQLNTGNDRLGGKHNDH